jgi:hypothetical protein
MPVSFIFGNKHFFYEVYRFLQPVIKAFTTNKRRHQREHRFADPGGFSFYH